ncbi:hypothetical protein GCM10023149_50180 [Mucilaginibacter gynuensis]|uniref:Pentapeptide MXKDX repeat protein n=1 Tax=Mucilaginibacter gynuensis TaxID=1302236 RepID=A0ABP8HHL5_9SPHI
MKKLTLAAALLLTTGVLSSFAPAGNNLFIIAADKKDISSADYKDKKDISSADARKDKKDISQADVKRDKKDISQAD